MDGGSTKRPLLFAAVALVVLGVGVYLLLRSDDEAPAPDAPTAAAPDADDRPGDESVLAESGELEVPPPAGEEPVTPPGIVVPPQPFPGPGTFEGLADAGPGGRSDEAPRPRRPRPAWAGMPHVRPTLAQDLQGDENASPPELHPVRTRERDPEVDARRNERIQRVFDERLGQLRSEAAEARRTGDLRRAADLDDLVQRMETSQAAIERRSQQR